MLDILKFHIFNLTSFSGRETRGIFWPYVGMVMILMMAGGMFVMIPFMANTFRKMQHFAIEHPDQVTVQQGPGSYSMQIEGHHPELMPDFGPMIWSMAAVGAVAILFVAAAVARRLHDSGRSGAWGLLPLPFIAFSYVMMPKMMGGGEPDMGLFFTIFASNLFYLIALCVLVALLVLPSHAHDNKYGPPPVA